MEEVRGGGVQRGGSETGILLELLLEIGEESAVKSGEESKTDRRRNAEERDSESTDWAIGAEGRESE